VLPASCSIVIVQWCATFPVVEVIDAVIAEAREESGPWPRCRSTTR
jgi:hypothetical protein